MIARDEPLHGPIHGAGTDDTMDRCEPVEGADRVNLLGPAQECPIDVPDAQAWARADGIMKSRQYGWSGHGRVSLWVRGEQVRCSPVVMLIDGLDVFGIRARVSVDIVK